MNIIPKFDVITFKAIKSDLFSCHKNIPETVKCAFCNFETNFEVFLVNHLKVVHKSQAVTFKAKIYKCRKCPYRTHSLLILLTHNCPPEAIMSEKKGRQSQGSECDQYTLKGKPIEAKMHEGKNQKAKDMEFECDQSDPKTPENEPLRRDTPEKTENSNSNEIFFSENKLLQHALNATNETMRFVCAHCPYKAKQKRHLDYHFLTKHADPDKIEWFKCELCDYKTPRKDYLREHVLMKHTPSEDITWFECEGEQCPFRTKKRSCLLRHVAEKHSPLEDIKWHNCEWCSYKSKQKSGLLRHVLAKHAPSTAIRWFQCEKCPYKAKQKDHLINHTLAKHADPDKIKWFTCGRCDFKSKRKDGLKRHMLAKHQIYTFF